MIAELEHQKESIMSLIGGKYNSEANLNKLANLKELLVIQLNAAKNSRKEIIKEISHIHFCRMNWLHLSSNEIESVEGLASVRMPCLQELFISRNNINSVRSLRKGQWPSLSTIKINCNYIKDNQMLTQGLFPKLELLWAATRFKWDKNIFARPSFPVKLESQSLTCLRIRTHSFAFRRSLKQAFSRKWEEIQIR